MLQADLELFPEDMVGAGGRDEALVLDETAGQIDVFPVRNIVEQEREGGEPLSVGLLVTDRAAREVLRGICKIAPPSVSTTITGTVNRKVCLWDSAFEIQSTCF